MAGAEQRIRGKRWRLQVMNAPVTGGTKGIGHAKLQVLEQEYTAEEFSYQISTNLESSYHLCQLAHPLLRASGTGSIVFISSVAGVVSCSVGSIYGATKSAISQLARNLACEWASDNIRANSIAPGVIATPAAKTV